MIGKKLLTPGQVAQELGCQVWQLTRLYELGLLPEPPRVGRCRILTRADVPGIKAALRKRGHLPVGK